MELSAHEPPTAWADGPLMFTSRTLRIRGLMVHVSVSTKKARDARAAEIRSRLDYMLRPGAFAAFEKAIGEAAVEGVRSDLRKRVAGEAPADDAEICDLADKLKKAQES